MKKALSLALCLFVFNSFAVATTTPSHKPKNRHIDLKSNEVKITEKGLCLYIDNQEVPVSCVFSGSKGLFIKECQLKDIPEFQSKGLHRCWCHNPDCPRESKIFIARKWRKYCSERCEYEAQYHKYDR